MRITLWGTRGSLASAGPDTVAYGGDTSAVEVRAERGAALVLDAGSGIRRLGNALHGLERVDVLLTHLHMDHIQGIGFFAPLYDPSCEVHIWGPPSSNESLESRLRRYLSPPLFPVRLRDLERVELHEIELGETTLGPFSVSADFVIHPGATVGYRVAEGDATLAYLPDHEPALGNAAFPDAPEWTSGYDLAAGADVLIHDAQYVEEEYAERVGWGHSTYDHMRAFATLTGVDTLVSFHHDPGHSDAFLDLIATDIAGRGDSFRFVPGRADTTIEA